MNLFVTILEITGTVSFALSGAILALEKDMDIFGSCILGVTTACGGGIIRDLLLGITPPSALRNPIYIIIAAISSIIIFLPKVRKKFTSNKKLFDTIMLVTDSLGLGIFTVSGVKSAIEFESCSNYFVVVFVAVITGVGGGVIRDVFAGIKPYIFVRHIYACAAISGGAVCTFTYNFLGEKISMLSGFVLIVIIRLCAAKYKWSLPKAHNIQQN